MGYVYERGSKLYIGFRDAAGVERQRSTGLDVGERSKAEKILAEVERRIAAQQDVVDPGPVTVERYFVK